MISSLFGTHSVHSLWPYLLLTALPVIPGGTPVSLAFSRHSGCEQANCPTHHQSSRPASARRAKVQPITSAHYMSFRETLWRLEAKGRSKELLINYYSQIISQKQNGANTNSASGTFYIEAKSHSCLAGTCPTTLEETVQRFAYRYKTHFDTPLEYYI